MSWNYRVIAHDKPHILQNKTKLELEEIYLKVVEMYYDKDGTPNGYALNKTAGSETIKGLNWTLNKMKLALKKPILSVKNFPAEYKIKKTKNNHGRKNKNSKKSI